MGEAKRMRELLGQISAAQRRGLKVGRLHEIEGWEEAAIEELRPRVLPASWTVETWDPKSGSGSYRGPGLYVITTVAREDDGKRWLHVSFSRKDRIPSYEDLRLIKELFVGRDRLAVQVFPAARKHVNYMETCLHLWHCLDGDPCPDFTRGGDLI